MRMRNAELRRLRRPQLPKTRPFWFWMWRKCLFTNGWSQENSANDNYFRHQHQRQDFQPNSSQDGLRIVDHGYCMDLSKNEPNLKHVPMLQNGLLSMMTFDKTAALNCVLFSPNRYKNLSNLLVDLSGLQRIHDIISSRQWLVLCRIGHMLEEYT